MKLGDSAHRDTHARQFQLRFAKSVIWPMVASRTTSVVEARLQLAPVDCSTRYYRIGLLLFCKDLLTHAGQRGVVFFSTRNDAEFGTIRAKSHSRPICYNRTAISSSFIMATFKQSFAYVFVTARVLHPSNHLKPF